MVKEKRNQLEDFFKDYEPAVQRIVKKVLNLEQQQIDSLRPRVRDDIRQIIEQEARKK